MNKQVIQISMNFVSQFMHLPVYFYALYYTFVLGTWYLVIVPKYICKTLYLYLYLNILNVLVLVPKY